MPSLFEKIWNQHIVCQATTATPAVLYIDLHLIHEVTSPQAFNLLREKGLTVRCPSRTLATMDHSTPTLPAVNGKYQFINSKTESQVKQLEQNCEEFGIELHGWDSEHRGIVHVMGPELGATQPGMTIVCGDSHTATHGAFGALAFGIGSTEVGHVLATQCLLQQQPKSMRITVEGTLSNGTDAKDLILYLIQQIGVAGGTGHVIEYAGSAIRQLNMEQRMTVCNMSVEAGARAGMIAPDQTTIDYLRDKVKTSTQNSFDELTKQWLELKSDDDAKFDSEYLFHANNIKPQVSYGTNPAMSVAINQTVPTPRNENEQQAIDYMQVESGKPMSGHTIDYAFIGSCTNGRLSDLKKAASVLRNKKVASHIELLVVPGSSEVKRLAEAEGLDKVFLESGAQWREPGCSMCIAMNGDIVPKGKTVISTSNRNFEGRQGVEAKTILASPATVAASAVAGYVTDASSLNAIQEASA